MEEMMSGKMNIGMGTGHLADAEFLESFESCRLDAALFHHADHLRLAWLCVRLDGLEAAQQRVAAAIRRFATHNGSPGKYHHTQTLAWVRLVAAAQRATPARSFPDFLAEHPSLLDRHLLGRYYSAACLDSPAACAEWVEPDLSPLPCPD